MSNIASVEEKEYFMMMEGSENIFNDPFSPERGL